MQTPSDNASQASSAHTKYTLYSLTSYDRSAKVRWIFTAAQVPFEEHRLNREQGENEGFKFLSLNPQGRVPVLEFDGRAMFESGAICLFLGDRFIESGLAPSLESSGRAEYLQWVCFASATLDTFQTRIMVIEDIPAGEVQEKKLAGLRSDLYDACVALNCVLDKTSYLVADRFSVADICVSYHLYWLSLWPELNSILQDFPVLSAYLERLKAIPSAVQANVFSYLE